MDDGLAAWCVGGSLLMLSVGCPGPAMPDVCEEDPCECAMVADVQPELLPVPEVGFEVWQDGSIEPYAWSQAAGDTVQCQRLDCLQDVVTLTFAAAAGGPRLEIEACGLAQRGTFGPLDPPSFPDCEPSQAGFVARWVDGEVWQTRPGLAPCQLLVNTRGSALTGTFECAGLRSESGREVRLSTGSFECAAEPMR